MKFEINRASCYDNATYDYGYEEPLMIPVPPCEEARLFGTSMDCAHYDVEINSIEDLIEFIKKYGSIVVGKNWGENDPKFKITIYDDYLE